MFSSLAICATCQVASRVAMAQPLGGMRLPLAIPTKSCSDIRKNSSPTTGRPTPKRFIICFSDGSCHPTPNSQDEILDPLCDVVGSLNLPVLIKLCPHGGGNAARRNVAHAL
jgi:hypothetical protein